MKIAILVSMFPPKWLGGTEIVTQNIAKGLADKENEVHILTSQDKDLAKETKEGRFFIHRIAYYRIRTLGTLFFWIKSFFCLKKINPQIVHSQTIQMAIPCFLARKFLRKPYLVYCHGSEVYFPWRFKKIISRLVLRNAGAVVALTENMKKEIEALYKGKVFVIPNGIDLKPFKSFSRKEMREELKMKKDLKIILFVGTLKQVKGVKYLIEAMDILSQKISEIRLLIVGDGEEKENLEKLVKKLNLANKVSFIGKVSNQEIPKYMAASNIFILPSLSEGFPVTILEAMASGLPIVATKVGGMSEIIKEGENGFLIPPKNPRAITEKVLNLLSNNEMRNYISQKNQEKVKNYSWDLIVNKLTKVYSLCLKK